MMWVIRGSSARSGGDFAMVVEARSQAAAEAWALKRGVPAAFIGQAEAEDIAEAKRTKQLWKYTPESQYRCFGKPIFARHLVALMLVGVMTAGVRVRADQQGAAATTFQLPHGGSPHAPPGRVAAGCQAALRRRRGPPAPWRPSIARVKSSHNCKILQYLRAASPRHGNCPRHHPLVLGPFSAAFGRGISRAVV
jgi:hypothetical protein